MEMETMGRRAAEAPAAAVSRVGVLAVGVPVAEVSSVEVLVVEASAAEPLMEEDRPAEVDHSVVVEQPEAEVEVLAEAVQLVEDPSAVVVRLVVEALVEGEQLAAAEVDFRATADCRVVSALYLQANACGAAVSSRFLMTVNTRRDRQGKPSRF